MKYVYKLEHKRFIEIDDEGDQVHNTKLLGFFSSKAKCKEVIPLYLDQPGFKECPNDFIIEKVEADVDDYNDIRGEFNSSVFFLTHEWDDDEYDYETCFGYYSTEIQAKKAQKLYGLEPEYCEHLDGFEIAEHTINVREWKEGFFSY